MRWMLLDDPPNEITALLWGVSLGKAVGSIATIHKRLGIAAALEQQLGEVQTQFDAVGAALDRRGQGLRQGRVSYIGHLGATVGVV
jgi:hypothetical protein